MPYCTVEDIEKMIASGYAAQLAQCGRGERGKAAIDASAFIDSFLAVRYAVPIAAPVPDAISRRAARIAIYMLLDWAGQGQPEIGQQHRDDIAWLMRVADGKIDLDQP